MDFLGGLRKLLGIDSAPQVVSSQPITYYEDGSNSAGGRAMDSPDDFLPQKSRRSQLSQAPFKMYEDNSFQGDPRQFNALNPGYKFYEDNSFGRQNQNIAPFADVLSQFTKRRR